MHLARRRGFSLIELVIALAIFAVLSTVGVGMMRSEIPRSRTRRAAREFAARVNECRNMAIHTGRECRVLLVSYDPSPSSEATENIGEYWVQLGDAGLASDTWDTLPVDEDGMDDSEDDQYGEGTVEITRDGEDELRWVSIGNWEDYQTIQGPAPTGYNQNAIVFNPRGFVANPSTDFSTNGYIEVPFLNRFAYVEGRTEAYMARVARSGMVRVDVGLSESLSDEGTAGTDEGSSGSPAAGTGGGGSGGEGGSSVDTGWTDTGGGDGGGGEGGGEGGFEGGGGEGGGWDTGFPSGGEGGGPGGFEGGGGEGGGEGGMPV